MSDLETISCTLNIAQLNVTRQSDGSLSATDDHDHEYHFIDPIRLFPLSSPNQWIRLIDGNSTEIAIIEDLEILPETSRKILQEELSKREFVPQIKRIISVSGKSEPSEWLVLTDRGESSFVMQSENDVRRLNDHGVLIIDAYGIRYLIPDDRNLDAASLKYLEWYLGLK